jgi:uncharacterized protein involved in exopolysaccharide biosynthesis
MERAMPQALLSHEEADRRTQNIFPPTPPRPTVGDAMRRCWPLVLIAILAFGAAGAYYGHSRPPVYKATASLTVGLADLTTQTVPGFAVGGEVVASAYSRSIQSDGVIVPAARALRMTPGQVRSRVTSTPVPSSPIFTITATGASPGDSVRVANAVSRSMIAYGRSRSSSAGAFAALLQRYRQAVRRRNQARSRVARLRSAASSGSTSSTGSSASGNGTLAEARADLQTEELRMDSLAEQYRSRAAAPGSTPPVQRLVDATGASNDRSSRVQLYGAIGALAGLCVGGALAVLFTGLRHRRRLAR